MTLIDEKIKIEISRVSASSPRAGFGTPLILGSSVPALDPQVVSVTTLAEVVTAGFAVETAEYIAASKLFGQAVAIPKILIGQVQAEQSFTNALNAIENINSDFFYIIPVGAGVTDDVIVELSTIVNTQKRILAVSTQSADVINAVADNILIRLATLAHKNTLLIYNATATANKPEAAWVGLMSSKDTGSEIWGYQQLTGVPVDSLTAVQRAYLETNKGNYYSLFGSRPATFNGIMINGDFADVTEGLYWLEYTMQLDIADMFTATGRIGYTVDGLGIVENVLRASLAKAVNRNIINPNFVITMPIYSDIATIDKQQRILRNVVIDATLTGAIQSINKVQLIVTY